MSRRPSVFGVLVMAAVMVFAPMGMAGATTRLDRVARIVDTDSVDQMGHSHLGEHVAISGDTMVAQDPANGLARVYVREGTKWVQQAVLSVPSPGTHPRVEISGDTVVFSGASVLVYQRTGSTWSGPTVLRFSTSSADIDGDTIVVAGGPGGGVPWVYTRGAGGWQLAAMLVDDARPNYWWGEVPAISGNTIVVGSPDGAVVFTGSGADWQKQAELTPAGGTPGDTDGEPADLSGDEAILAGRGGVGYVFERSGSAWTQTARLVGSGPGQDAYVDTPVAIDGETALVSVTQQSDVYRFRKTDGVWTQDSVCSDHEPYRLTSGGAFARLQYGTGVALSGSEQVIGGIHYVLPDGTQAGIVDLYDSFEGGAAIHGVVTDSHGAPVAGMTVTAVWQEAGDVKAGPNTVTADDGSFGLDSLAAGTYYLTIEDPLGRYVTATTAPTALAGADHAELSPSLVPAGVVSGTGSAVAGGPLPGVIITLYSAVSGDAVASATAAPDGTYRIAGVPLGRYKLGFRDQVGAMVPAFSGGAASLADASVVTLAENAPVTCDFALSLDTEPPVTQSNIDAGWVSGPKLVTLTASDAGRVAATYLSVPPYTYTGPFQVSAEGTTPITYYSVDANNNWEQQHTELVRIDDTPPSTTATVSRGSIGLSASDALSGVVHTSYRIDGGSWRTGTTVAEVPGSHTLEYFSTDAAGNDESPHSLAFKGPEHFEETDPRLAYSGGWSAAKGMGFSGGALTLASAPASMNVSFDGTGINVVALTGPTYGIARLTLDGTPAGAVDLYAPAYAYARTVWRSTVLGSGRHTLTVSWTGTANPSANTARVNVDAFDVDGGLATAPPLPIRYEQTDSHFSYSGTWTTATGAGFSGGSLAYSGTGTMTAAFDGISARLVALTGPTYGIARISVDGGGPDLIDLYSPTYGYARPVWASPDLPAGPHTVTISESGTKNPTSTSMRVDVDALEIAGDPTTASPTPLVFDQTDPRLAFAGAWTTATGSAFSGGSLAYASGPATLTAIFVGDDVDLIALTGPLYGIASVSVDGGRPQLVDLYSADWVFRKDVWSGSGLGPGVHALSVSSTGTKNPAASQARIDVDAIVVTGQLR